MGTDPDKYGCHNVDEKVSICNIGKYKNLIAYIFFFTNDIQVYFDRI